MIANKLVKALVGLSLVLGFQSVSKAQTPAVETVCQSADILGTGLINKICWSCMFPISTAGISFGDDDEIPDGAVDDPFCICDKNGFGPSPGITAGAWWPARFFEIVDTEFCSPVLGGVHIAGDGFMVGEVDGQSRRKSGAASYMEYHEMTAPLMYILELITSPNCSSDGYFTLDLIDMSEFNPFWREDYLALLINPEAAALANPLIIASCVAKCTLATAGVINPLSAQNDAQWYCAGVGCWGHLYPLSGNIEYANSPVQETSLMATRALAYLHRTGRAFKTVGNDALCGGEIYPTIPNSQYKWSMVYPVPEASGQCCHFTGESTFKWGEHRSRPYAKSYVYMLWRWGDCCVN